MFASHRVAIVRHGVTFPMSNNPLSNYSRDAAANGILVLACLDTVLYRFGAVGSLQRRPGAARGGCRFGIRHVTLIEAFACKVGYLLIRSWRFF
jgi:hypothetical protein